jgi:hypothetical protein
MILQARGDIQILCGVKNADGTDGLTRRPSSLLAIPFESHALRNFLTQKSESKRVSLGNMQGGARIVAPGRAEQRVTVVA